MNKDDQLRILEEFAKNSKASDTQIIDTSNINTNSGFVDDVSIHDLLESVNQIEKKSSKLGRNKKPEMLNENVTFGMTNVGNITAYNPLLDTDVEEIDEEDLFEGDDCDPTSPIARKRRCRGTSVSGGSSSTKEMDSESLVETDKSPTDDISELMIRLKEIEMGIIDKAVSDSELKEAIKIKKTPTGAQIGDWEIKSLTEGQKEYNVINKITGNSIADKLELYEAALGIVRILNKGKGLNSSEMKKILELEESFSRFKVKAVNARRVASNAYKNGDTAKGEIFENEFELFRSKAHKAKNDLRQLIDNME